MIARYISAVATGTVVTYTIFYVMHALVAMQPGVYSEPRPRGELGMLPTIEEKDVVVDLPEITRDFVDPPTPPPRPASENDADMTIDVARTAPPTPRYETSRVGFRPSDGPLVNVFRVKPMYPVDMARRGLDGYVVVEFDVLADGRVANVTVVESSHRGFEKEAVKAAYKFRYKARVVDGVPQVSTGVRNLFRFEMEN